MKKITGFTLIELLVVISIIALLSSVVLASLTAAREKAKYSVIIQTIREIRTEAELVKNANKKYEESPYFSTENGCLSGLFYDNSLINSAINRIVDDGQTRAVFGRDALACRINPDGWIMQLEIKNASVPGNHYEGYGVLCFDSNGYVGQPASGVVFYEDQPTDCQYVAPEVIE
jgi:prepilin-type N-terminal cleavage/methylation domain-containing protein